TEHTVQPKESNLLIGRGAEEIALLSDGMPAMDSDGAMLLTTKIDVYHAGWFMVWTDDPPLRAIYVSKKKQMVQQAIFPNLDRDDGAGIVLYRLLPKEHP